VTQELSPEEAALIERVAKLVVDRQMAVPAVLLIESGKPLSFLGGQALRFLEPSLKALLDRPEVATAAGLLEDREKLDLLLRRIEALEHERLRARAAPAEEKP